MTREKKPVRQYEALKILWESRNRHTNNVDGPCIVLRSCGFDTPSVVIRHLEKDNFLLVDNTQRAGGLRGGTITAVRFTENGIAKARELCGESLNEGWHGDDSKNESNVNRDKPPLDSGASTDTLPTPSLDNLISSRGRGALRKNLEMILRALWDVAKDGIVIRPKQILEKHISAPLKYLNLLEDAGCIEMTISGGRGKAIESIRLLKKFLPEPNTPSAERIVSRQSEALIADRVSANGSEQFGHVSHPDNIAIFIDVPNVVVREDLGIYQIHWPLFVARIAGTRTVRQISAYVAVPTRIENKKVFQWRPFVALTNAGIHVVWRRGAETGGRKADIDQMMSYDLGVFACTPSDIGTLILVTGDDDFSHAVCDIKKRKNIKVEVCCWKNRISPASSLWSHAVVRFLDSFAPEFLLTSIS